MEQNCTNICGQEAHIFYSSIQMFSGMKLLKLASYTMKPTLYIRKNLNGKTKLKTHNTKHNSFRHHCAQL